MKPPWPIGLLLLLLGAGAFWDGLYAPAQHLLLVGALALTVLGWQDAPALSPRLHPGVAADAVAVLLLLGSALLTALVRPAAAGVAAHGPVVAAGWVLAYRLGRATGERLAAGLAWLWFLSGPLMAFGGLAAFSYLPAHHSGRLAAALGYPVAVGVLGMLGLAGGAAVARGLTPALAGPLWFGNGLAVLLSGSRGVWAATLLLGLLLGLHAHARSAAGRRLAPGWPLAAAVALAALAAALWAGPAVAAREPGPAWLAVSSLGLTVAAAGAFQAVRPGALASGALAAVAAAAAAAAPGWGWLLGRTALSLTEGSAVERLAFLRDGLRLMQAQPLGAGYRAWSSLHLQGASYGYYSAEAHSALIDLGLAFGWAGVAAFLWLLGRLVWAALRPGGRETARRPVLAGLAVLGLHSLVDWNLSYAIFAVPLWLGFGLAGGGGDSAPRPEARPAGSPRWPIRGLAGLALAAAALLAAGDLAVWLGERALARSDLPAALRHAELAAGIAPWDDAAHALGGRALAAAGRRGEALEAVARARRLNPYEPWYAELYARQLVAAGPAHWRAAGVAYREFVRLWPWHGPAYAAALESLMDLALRARLLGEEALAADLRADGRAILAQLDTTKAREPATIPRRPLDVNSPALTRLRPFFAARP